MLSRNGRQAKQLQHCRGMHGVVADTVASNYATLRPVADSIFSLPDTVMPGVNDNWGG